MKEIMEKAQQQMITNEDYLTMVKIIQAALQRGAIKPEEMVTVGGLYEKLKFHLIKVENEQKEKTDGGLSKTNN
tara:strand:- start:109 stop:330 length:222 start_codon:yes stop_codon:yes gene_type:complete